MNKLFKKLHDEGKLVTDGSNLHKLTAKGFLGLEGEFGYFERVTLLTYLQSLREPEIEQLDQTIDCTNQGRRMIGTIVTRLDKGNRPYTYLNFVKLNATVGLKVILEGGMKQFILDYQDAKFKVGFTLAELVEEAMNE